MNASRSAVQLCLTTLFIALCVTAPRAACAQQGRAASAMQNGSALSSLAPTPPMGWASWNHFFCDYNEQTIRAEADALVSSGMRDAGYKYVVIQECIARDRDAQGNLIVDSARFPSGMPALVAYIHRLGLKAGIYTDIGLHTCYPNPPYQGSYGHEQQDADTFAAWGMDFIEMDYCNRVEEHTGRWVYERMADAIKKTGRPMIFYICSWGNEQPWEWAQGKAQMWRTDFDISLEKNHVDWSRMVRNFESNAQHSVFSAPNSWNDPDMLEIGNPGLDDAEAQAQMSMWAISAAPLLAGADMTQIDAATRAMLTNKEVIAVDQDPLGAGPEKISGHVDGVEVWAKPLASKTSGIEAVLLLNLTASSENISVQWSDLGLLPQVKVRDLWAHKDLGIFPQKYLAQIPAHGAKLLKVSGRFNWKNGAVVEAEWPGNLRRGGTKLLDCGECSQGFAMSIGGVDGQTDGSLSFRHVVVDQAASYKVELTYVRNGLGDKTIYIQVNSAPPFPVKALMREWNWVTVPVNLQAGDNTITVSYSNKDKFNIDKLRLFR
jgi:alpha-galactosidase